MSPYYKKNMLVKKGKATADKPIQYKQVLLKMYPQCPNDFVVNLDNSVLAVQDDKLTQHEQIAALDAETQNSTPQELEEEEKEDEIRKDLNTVDQTTPQPQVVETVA